MEGIVVAGRVKRWLKSRVRREDWIAIALIAVGLALQVSSAIVGEFVDRVPRGAEVIFMLSILIGLLLGSVSVCSGFGLYAVNRGRSALWGLFGVMSIYGLPILLVLKDLREEPIRIPSGDTAGGTSTSALPKSDNPYQSF